MVVIASGMSDLYYQMVIVTFLWSMLMFGWTVICEERFNGRMRLYWIVGVVLFLVSLGFVLLTTNR